MGTEGKTGEEVAGSLAAGVREVPETKGDTVSPLSNEAGMRDEP